MRKMAYRICLCAVAAWLSNIAVSAGEGESLKQIPLPSDLRPQKITAAKDAAVEAALDKASAGSLDQTSLQPEPEPETKPSVKFSGIAHTSFGIESDGTAVFRRANPDLNERNFRLQSNSQLNNQQNTFDPALYSRLKVVMDATVSSSVGMHVNLTNDPWSWAGKTKEVVVNQAPGVDSVRAQYFFAGNTGYTVNRVLYTLKTGDSIALPEIKVKNGKVPATTVTSNFGGTYNIPEMEVDYTYWPLREAWVDWKLEENAKLRIFPMAYQDQALTSDDPLKLSNNKMWWEESPWLRDWRQGTFNSLATPVDYTKGQWDRTLSFGSRDSDGLRLTALRGVSLDVNPDGETTLQATVATPKTLWQDYNEITAVPASVRVKHFINDQLYVGSVAAAHQGFVDSKRDAENYVGSLDAGFVPLPGFEINGQYSFSRSRYDQTNRSYATKKQGQAYYLSLEASSDPSDVLKKDYFGLAPAQQKDDFSKMKFYWAEMEPNFESTLSNYHETRDDSFWSRHLTFYPSTYGKLPGASPTASEDDMTPFAIGNGIDYGRAVIGWRGDTRLMQDRVHGLVDFRRVMNTSYKHLETVARTQWTYKATDRFTTKAIVLAHVLPKTTAGWDPFVVDGDTGEPLANTAVRGGMDPTLKTGSLGARYELNDWAAVNGVWEYTNDFTVAADNFPRGVLNSSSFTTYQQDGKMFRKSYPFLYKQDLFDQAPYSYHNIFKTGLELTPDEAWHVYLDYTRNPNRFAGNIDDNMNHYGIETAFVPNQKFGFFARYTYSMWNDFNLLDKQNEVDYRGYSNVFLEARLLPGHDSMLSLQYGVGPAYNVASSSSDPILAYYASPVLTTQHLFRIICEKKF